MSRNRAVAVLALLVPAVGYSAHAGGAQEWNLVAHQPRVIWSTDQIEVLSTNPLHNESLGRRLGLHTLDAWRVLGMAPEAGQELRVALIPGLPATIDGHVDRTTGTIRLPEDRVVGWADDRLRNTLRHELAHLHVARVTESAATIPLWLQEGIATWLAEGVTCEATSRVRVRATVGVRVGLPAPSFQGFRRRLGRLEYDLAALVVDEIEAASPGAISEDRLILALRSQSLREALLGVVGVEVSTLERRWSARIERIADSDTGGGSG